MYNIYTYIYNSPRIKSYIMSEETATMLLNAQLKKIVNKSTNKAVKLAKN